MTRRRFLERGAAVSAGLAMSSSLPSTVLGANERMRVALIGCGGRGSYVARGMAAAGAQIVSLCDLSEERRDGVNQFLERQAPGHAAGQVKKVARMERVFEDPSVDSVIVATPDHWHALASIAHRIGNRKVRFDATTERFDDSEANALLGRTYRPEYRVPESV